MEQNQQNENQQEQNQVEKKVVVCALYKFVRFPQFEEFKPKLQEFMEKNEICGSLLIAQEGINGTVASSREGIDKLLEFLNSEEVLNPIEYKESYTVKMPFKKSKVKVKKEIVTMGVENVDPLKVVGTYVQPEKWNEVISDPECVVIDTRNDYEYKIGTFDGALNPNIHNFTEFPDYLKQNFKPQQHKKIAMFCTGGIRCEKSTAFAKELGFEEVYHLKGGILKYLEQVPKEQSKWKGECYVFDERVSVDHDLKPGQTGEFYTGKLEDAEHKTQKMQNHQKYLEEQQKKKKEREQQYVELNKQKQIENKQKQKQQSQNENQSQNQQQVQAN